MMLSRFVVSQVKHNSYFLVGLALGLWLALAGVPLGEEEVLEGAPCAAPQEMPPGVAQDEFEPHREARPLGAAGPAAGRSITRPRYYTTELGMRAPLLAGALSSEDALGTRVAALNRTLARLQPALRFFMTASALQAAPGLANVVGFTDTREMLKPFHALKYLADNYLDEYEFFFLVSDATFVNARRLSELVARLSVSADLYMGAVADDDTHYCSLEGGILLSNSVLRAVHAELDWCVRNSYSPHHHENIGRCVLHAAHLSCSSSAQGESYVSLRLAAGAAPEPALAEAVSAHPVSEPAQLYRLHAYVSRVFLERDRAEAVALRGYLWRNWRRHPPHYRNASWPAGLRADPGLAPPRPETRFDHLRWTAFNATHVLMPDEHRAVAPLAGAHRDAVDAVWREASAWAARAWRAGARLAEGAWRWEPPAALRYRLLLRLPAPPSQSAHPSPAPAPRHRVVGVEVSRVLGAARLVPVPYVTESARLTLLLPVAGPAGAHLAAFLDHYEAVCLRTRANTALLLVRVRSDEAEEEEEAWRAAVSGAEALADKYRGAALRALDPGAGGAGLAAPRGARTEAQAEALAARKALEAAAAAGALARDALVLLLHHPRLRYSEDFLNRVRMNSIAGTSWFWPMAFARFAQYEHPRFRDAHGARPQLHTGRFNALRTDAVAFYRRDYDSALAEWRGGGGGGAGREAGAAEVLAGAGRALRCVRAPEPGLVLQPAAAPCRAGRAPAAALRGECLRAHRARGFSALDLGARTELAKLLLETQADAEPRRVPPAA